MASVLNKTTLEYIKSTNTPDYSEVDWIINPDVSQVINIPRKYWKLDGETPVEMTEEEKNQVDLNEANTETKIDSPILVGYKIGDDLSSNSTTLQNCISLDVKINKIGSYKIEWIYDWACSNNKYKFKMNVEILNKSIIKKFEEVPYMSDVFLSISDYYIIDLMAGNYTINLNYCSQNLKNTSTIQNCKMFVWRIK